MSDLQDAGPTQETNQEPQAVSNVVPFKFENFLIRTLVGAGGDPWFVAVDVCAALQIANPRDAVARLDSDEKGVGSTDTLGGVQDLSIVNEAGMYTLALRCRDAVTQGTAPYRFRKWVTSEVLPAIRKTGQYHAPVQARSQPSRAEAMLLIAESAARMLRLSDTSKVRMLSTIAKEEGLPTSFLPVYVDEPLVRSLTALLKEHGVLLSAVAAYPKLEGLGIVERLTRIGSKGTVKKFWSLTPAGLYYGRNENHPNNPRETQPLFYVHLFSELLGRLQ